MRVAARLPRPVIVAACLALLLGPPPLAAKGKPDKPSPVTLTQVTQAELRSEVELFGNSQAKQRVMLSPRIAGLATELAVDVGDRVAPGDLILKLDARLAELRLDIAQARIAAAQAKRRDVQRRLKEFTSLKSSRHISETTIESTAAELEIASAELARERAELAREQELIARHQVFAPFAGMVTEKFVEIGQWVQQDDAVVELVALDTLRIRANLPQRHFTQVQPGSPARVRFDALPATELTGQIRAKVAAGDDRSRNFPLLIDIDNREHGLAPGMSARVWVALGSGGETVKLLPRDAIVAKPGGQRQVWRVSEQDGVLKANPVSVQLGRTQGDRVVVISAELQAGDRIVMLGNESLGPGQTIVERPAIASGD